MKTKEQILNDHGRLISGPTMNAMDEYAKQQSIGFFDWANKNYIQCEVTNEWKEAARASQFRYSTKELYNQFIESQNK